MAGYAKLHSAILDSTIWNEPNHVRIVWITMLAMADADGYVAAAVPGLAYRAHVSIQECEQALGKFLAPDPYSRTQEHEGRRITEADGGWILLNYQKHREERNLERRREQNREAQARWRAKRKADISEDKPSKPESAQAEAEAEAEADQNPPIVPPLGDAQQVQPPDEKPKRKRKAPSSPLPADFTPTDEHKATARKHGLDLGLELDKFRAHAEATDRRQVRWNATFRQWLLSAASYRIRSAPTVGQPAHGVSGFRKATVIQ